jgi:hypothetical protein
MSAPLQPPFILLEGLGFLVILPGFGGGQLFVDGVECGLFLI